MFSKLRRARISLSSRDAEARLAALAALRAPSAAEQSRIDTLAREDPDDRVRRRALGLATDRSLLRALLDDPTVGEAAAQRLVALEPDTADPHPRIVKAQLALGQTPAAVGAGLDDLDSLIELTLTSRGDAQAQLLAHEGYSSSRALSRLERASRDRNKVVNRFARERLEAIKDLRALARRHEDRMAELMAALTKHLSGDPDSAGFRDKLRKLETAAAEELVLLEGACSELAGYAEPTPAVDELRGQLQTLAAAVPAAAEVVPDVASAPPAASAASRPETFASLAAQFADLDATLAAAHDFAALAATRQTLTERWLEAANHEPPDAAEHAIFERFSHRFRQLADAHSRLESTSLTPAPEPPPAELPGADSDDRDSYWRAASQLRRWERDTRRRLAQLAWPGWATPPAVLASTDAALTRASEQLEALDARVAQEEARLDDCLKQLDAAIAEGASHSAQQQLSDARQGLRRLPKATADRLGKSLNKAAARLGELKDWQAYATSPKREALCEAMAALHDEPLPAPDQAARIKALRAEWNALGTVASSADRRLAERFNRSAEQAFEPCRAYFAEQGRLREANLNAREAICEQLSRYLETTDWAEANIKAAEQILRTARSEWRRHHPVDRRAGKGLEARFEALQADLHGHIKAAWDKNLAHKEQIVREAQALLDLASVGDRVNGAKALQQRWQQVGPVPRKPDQQLWRQFRKACDAVFDSLADEKRAADAAVTASEQEARELLDSFARRLEEEGADAALLRRFEAEFAALPPLPGRLQRALSRRFDELERECRSQLRARADAAREAELEAMLAAPPSEPGDADAQALRALVIEAEIAAELDSAPEDKEQRIALQVEMMNTHRGRPAADALDLARRWRDLGDKPPDAEPLRGRLLTALKKLNR